MYTHKNKQKKPLTLVKFTSPFLTYMLFNKEYPPWWVGVLCVWITHCSVWLISICEYKNIQSHSWVHKMLSWKSSSNQLGGNFININIIFLCSKAFHERWDRGYKFRVSWRRAPGCQYSDYPAIFNHLHLISKWVFCSSGGKACEKKGGGSAWCSNNGGCVFPFEWPIWTLWEGENCGEVSCVLCLIEIFKWSINNINI